MLVDTVYLIAFLGLALFGVFGLSVLLHIHVKDKNKRLELMEKSYMRPDPERKTRAVEVIAGPEYYGKARRVKIDQNPDISIEGQTASIISKENSLMLGIMEIFRSLFEGGVYADSVAVRLNYFKHTEATLYVVRENRGSLVLYTVVLQHPDMENSGYECETTLIRFAHLSTLTPTALNNVPVLDLRCWFIPEEVEYEDGAYYDPNTPATVAVSDVFKTLCDSVDELLGEATTVYKTTVIETGLPDYDR